ncbi:MAG: glycosyltransferase family 1 protein [Vicinamibacterales bacterium]
MADHSLVYDASSLLARPPTGVTRYTRELLASLLALGDAEASRSTPRFALTVAAHRRLAGEILGFAPHLASPESKRWWWMQVHLPRQLARVRPALCHFTNGFAPLLCPVPYVLTVHDTSLWRLPMTQPWRSLIAIRPLLPAIVRRAARVIVPSRAVALELEALARIPGTRIDVTPEGVDARFSRVAAEAELDRVRRSYALDRPFVLAVGTQEPRKNLERLIQAFLMARPAIGATELVLVGHAGWRRRRLRALMEQPDVRRTVRSIGFVPDADLPALYTLAAAVAMPSLYEGFGLPVLEAMACGTAVITSRGSGLQEVAGDAAVLVEPERVDSIAEGLVTLLTDPSLRDELADKGVRRARPFTWAQTAASTRDAYVRALTRA